MTQREPWYELDGDAGGILLTNTNTGAYVTIAPRKRNEDLVFSINVRRPRFFALEAVLTLERLAAQFNWKIDDPQRGTRLTFDAHECAQTIARWDEENAAAGPLAGGVAIDAQTATRVWRWNYERPTNEAQLRRDGGAVTIPRIFFTARTGERAHTMALWPADCRSVVLPEVDDIVLREHAGDTGTVLNRALLAERAAYYTHLADHQGVPVIAAADQATVQAAIAAAKRAPFTGEIVASDMLREET